MSLFYRDKKDEHAHSCECNHEHHHEHEHHSKCGHDHHHEHHHGHSHGCGCGCEGAEVDNKKLAAGVVLFLAAMIVFHIPGLFKSIDEITMDTIELVVFLLIYLLTANEIVVNAIKNLFKGKALDEQFLMTIASLGAFLWENIQRRVQ